MIILLRFTARLQLEADVLCRYTTVRTYQSKSVLLLPCVGTGSNAIVCVCPSVRLSVSTLTFEPSDF